MGYYTPRQQDPVWLEFGEIEKGFQKLPQPGEDKINKLVKFSADGMALESKSVDETVNEGIDAVDDAEIGPDDIVTFIKRDGAAKSLKKLPLSGFQGAMQLRAEQVNSGLLDDQRLPAATRQKKGALRIARAADMETGTDDTMAATPARVRAQVGAKVSAGEKRAATITTVRRFSPKDVKDMVGAHAEEAIPAATAAAPGKVALATPAEVREGTDEAKAVTAAGLQSRIGAGEGQLAALDADGWFDADRVPDLGAEKIGSGVLDPQRFMHVQDAMPDAPAEGAFWLQSTTGRLRQYLKNKRLFLFSSATDSNDLTVLRTDGTVDEATGRDFSGFASRVANYKSLVVTDTRVYILRSDRHEVHVYDLDDLSLETTFGIPERPSGAQPKAMAVRGERVYIVGTTAGPPAPWMRVTDLTGARQAEEEFAPPAVEDDGMAATPERLRFVVEGTVRSYDLSGSRQAAEEFDLHADNANPHGVEIVGNEDRAYVYDDDATRLFVYDLGGNRQQDEEIDTSGFVTGRESGAIGYLSTAPVWQKIGAR